MAKKKVKILPLAALATKRPCEKQMRIVRKEWPDGIPLTEESLERALGLGLDVRFLEYLLYKEQLREYSTLWYESVEQRYRDMAKPGITQAEQEQARRNHFERLGKELLRLLNTYGWKGDEQ